MRKLRAGGLALLGAILLTLGGMSAAQATGSPPPNTNEVAYWCEGGHGVKYDNLNSTSFVVPSPPNGFVWTLLVLKAGSDQSVPNENETFPNPVVGQSYSHSSGKTLSHAILCKAYAPTTTQGSTTTYASTTLATTTVPTTIATTTTAGTTTTQGSTTTIATTTTAGSTTTASTSTTVGTTTTAATTTVPQTTTTAGTTTTVRDCCEQTTTTASTTSTTVGTTTIPTTAPTTTVAVTTIPDTTAVDQTLPPSATTVVGQTTPVTGSSTTPEILFGMGAIALGLAGIDFSKQRRNA